MVPPRAWFHKLHLYTLNSDLRFKLLTNQMFQGPPRRVQNTAPKTRPTASSPQWRSEWSRERGRSPKSSNWSGIAKRAIFPLFFFSGPRAAFSHFSKLSPENSLPSGLAHNGNFQARFIQFCKIWLGMMRLTLRVWSGMKCEKWRLNNPLISVALSYCQQMKENGLIVFVWGINRSRRWIAGGKCGR